MNSNFLEKLSEKVVNNKIKYFLGYEEILNNLENISDLIFQEKKNTDIIELDFFDINFNILLYGEPGVGKTSLAYKLSNYVLDKYGVDTYQLSIPNIIETNLGKTTSNMHKAIENIYEHASEYGIYIILDEVDRIFTDRKKEEISELKRMLLEFTDFLDRVNINDGILIVGITNLKDTLDAAFLRRFSFQYEIKNNKELICNFIKMCNDKVKINIKDSDIDKYSDYVLLKNKNCDYIKNMYKREIIGNIYDISNLEMNITKQFEELGGN
ncbi:ATP-binding protein [Brachyspira intermedia]|uniref:ATP-binding protein n=1 Tax=Brachyspira intermedia TaxID=84377 RepID=UPI003007A7B4